MRDHLVLDACLRRNIPVATVIGGGYDELSSLVKRHALVLGRLGASSVTRSLRSFQDEEFDVMRFAPLLILGGCLIALLLKPVFIGVEETLRESTIRSGSGSTYFRRD